MGISKRRAAAKPLVTAVIVAAGKGERMGAGIDKQLAPLCGMPVVARTIAAFEESLLTDEIVVVVSSAGMVPVAAIVKEFGFEKVVRIVAGGQTRQQSAAAGFAAANPATLFVAVHDGARPLIAPQAIDDVVAAAIESGAAAAAVRVKDTIKVADAQGFVVSTPERAALWAVQTPQAFGAELYRAALAAAERSGADYTDDCQLAEAAGRRVKLVECAYTNIKITTREDICYAQAILEEGAQGDYL